MPCKVECDMAPSRLSPYIPSSHPMVETHLSDPMEKCPGDLSRTTRGDPDSILTRKIDRGWQACQRPHAIIPNNARMITGCN